MIIPEYNYILYNLVYNIRNNKHIIFAIWLSKLPEGGTMMKLSSLNKKFGLNYKSANDFCFKFLKTAKINFNKYNNLSLNYHYKGDSIFIHPFILKRQLIKIYWRIPRKSQKLQEGYTISEKDMVYRIGRCFSFPISIEQYHKPVSS